MFERDNLVEKRILANRNRRLILAIDHQAQEFVWLTQLFDEVSLPEWATVDSGKLPLVSLDILIEVWQCLIDTPNDVLVTPL